VGKPVETEDPRDQPLAKRTRTLAVPKKTAVATTKRKRESLEKLTDDLGTSRASMRARVGAPRQSSESSSSSSASEAGVAGRRRTLQRRSKRRMLKYLELAVAKRSLGETLLEYESITPRVALQYDKEVDEFLRKTKADPAKESDTQIDEKLVKYCESLFFSGYQASRGMKLLAGMMHRWPGFSRTGHRTLPRSWKGLKGWKKLTPGRSRRPEPRWLWCALANTLGLMGRRLMGFYVLTALSTYLRPCSLLAIKPQYLVRPVLHRRHWTLLAHPHEGGQPSKTQEYDLSVALDSQFMSWADPVFEELARGQADQPIWGFDYWELTKSFKEACKRLNLELVLYQARHSGASIDHESGARTIPEIKHRGAWRSDKSVLRYDKHARLGHSTLRHPQALRLYGLECEKRLADGFLQGRWVPLPANLNRI